MNLSFLGQRSLTSSPRYDVVSYTSTTLNVFVIICMENVAVYNECNSKICVLV